MLADLKGLSILANRRPEWREAAKGTDAMLHVIVVFTSIDATIAALKRAGILARGLGGHITLLAPQIVPYPLPLTDPPVPLDFNEGRLRAIAGESRVDTSIRLCVCRERFEMLRMVLQPHSLIVIGGRRKWWTTSEQHLARKLIQAGHDVIFVTKGVDHKMMDSTDGNGDFREFQDLRWKSRTVEDFKRLAKWCQRRVEIYRKKQTRCESELRDYHTRFGASNSTGAQTLQIQLAGYQELSGYWSELESLYLSKAVEFGASMGEEEAPE